MALALLPAAADAQVPGLPPLPILGDPLSALTGGPPTFEGRVATPNPFSAPDPPRHPFMAPNGRSNIHDDAYMTDTYQGAGPLGSGIDARSTLFARECGSITFDAQGRLVTVCVGVDRAVLALLDPRTLDVLAAFPLPPRNPASPGFPFNDFTGGGYFYLDHLDRAVVPTADRHLYVLAQTPGPGFTLARDYDLTSSVPQGDGIISVLPDWWGRIWFASVRGVVGTIDPASGNLRSIQLAGEGITNSFAVDDTGGAFIVSDKALYRFDAAPDGSPQQTWRETYANVGVRKPGQSDAGSGTTPTLMGTDYVAITDNADPMNVVVHRRAASAPGSRLVCTEPVFSPGAGATDQSLIGAGRAMVVENNFGYSGVTSTMSGGVTSPGLQRVDIDEDGEGCHRVWRSEERAPSVVPKLSLANGLVYTFTKPPRSDRTDAWYFTALDFRTGETIYRRLAGTGFGYNNNFAPVTLGPDRTAYVGALGGLTMFRDAASTPNAQGPGNGADDVVRRLRLALFVSSRGRRLGVARLARSEGRCAGRHFRVRLGGLDRADLRSVAFSIGGRSLGTDRSLPFRRRFSIALRARRTRHRVRAKITMKDGRRAVLQRGFAACASGR